MSFSQIAEHGLLLGSKMELSFLEAATLSKNGKAAVRARRKARKAAVAKRQARKATFKTPRPDHTAVIKKRSEPRKQRLVDEKEARTAARPYFHSHIGEQENLVGRSSRHYLEYLDSVEQVKEEGQFGSSEPEADVEIPMPEPMPLKEVGKFGGLQQLSSQSNLYLVENAGELRAEAHLPAAQPT